MVVGYAPTSPRVSMGKVVEAASWQVLLLSNGSLVTHSWYWLGELCPAEEWHGC